MPTPKPHFEPVDTSQLTRLDLIDMVNRMRAAHLVDLPDLSGDRQTVVRHILDSTAIHNDEGLDERCPRNSEIRLDFHEESGLIVLTHIDWAAEIETETEIDGVDEEMYKAFVTAFADVGAGAALTFGDELAPAQEYP